MATPLNSANRFAHIDAMRAFAVMVVVIAHAGLGHIVPGGSGVTIFFSISGFIITYLLLRERQKTDGFSVSSFYRRRFFKIFPPFAVAVIVPSLIWSIQHPIDWTAFLAQI
ncbi:acyltransferase family protein, partial [Streptomyces albidoflavus]